MGKQKKPKLSVEEKSKISRLKLVARRKRCDEKKKQKRAENFTIGMKKHGVFKNIKVKVRSAITIPATRNISFINHPDVTSEDMDLENLAADMSLKTGLYSQVLPDFPGTSVAPDIPSARACSPVIDTTLLDSHLVELENRAEEELNREKEHNSKQKQREKQTSKQQRQQEEWDVLKDIYFHAFISEQAFTPTYCITCHKTLDQFYVKCNSCKKKQCNTCDASVHSENPFHDRVLFTNEKMQYLLPTQFITKEGNVNDTRVPIPCLVPEQCRCCKNKPSVRKLVAGDRMLAIITKDGRFDLYEPYFFCLNCKNYTAATNLDYIKSGWWPPSSQMNGAYVFCTNLLSSWHHISHKAPGTSERKFIEALEEVSKSFNRPGTICRRSFSSANKFYQHLNFLIEVQAKLMTYLLSCFACGTRPKAMHIDAIMKLYRFLSAQGLGTLPVFGSFGISSMEELQAHIDKIDAAKPRKTDTAGKDTCGGSSYKAGRAEGQFKKKLASTGMVYMTCGHGVLIQGADMNKGESYRHVHFLHDVALNMGAEILCYDVICNYWPFAQDLAKKVPDFQKHVTTMKPFLSRFHGNTHELFCQILYSGHWVQGAGLKSGETTEQSNSKMYRYGSVTKHMGAGNRIDHLTMAMIYFNKEKHESMARQLVINHTKAQRYLELYSKKLNELLKAREQRMDSQLAQLSTAIQQEKKEKSDDASQTTCMKHEEVLAKLLDLKKKDINAQLEDILSSLKNIALKNRRRRITPKTPLAIARYNLEAVHQLIQNLKQRVSKEADSSKQRMNLRRHISKEEQKASNLLKIVNDLSVNIGSAQLITKKDFDAGIFPWKESHEINIQQNFQLINTWMLVQRSTEEIEQVKSEMSMMLSELEKTRSNLQNLYLERKDLPYSEAFLRGGAFIARQESARLDNVMKEANRQFGHLIKKNEHGDMGQLDVSELSENKLQSVWHNCHSNDCSSNCSCCSDAESSCGKSSDGESSDGESSEDELEDDAASNTFGEDNLSSACVEEESHVNDFTSMYELDDLDLLV